MDLSSLLKQAGDMRNKMAQLEKVLGTIEVVGEAGGGMICVTVNGKLEVVKVQISKQGRQEGPEVLEELIAAAVNDALSKVHEIRRVKQMELLGLPSDLNIPFS